MSARKASAGKGEANSTSIGIIGGSGLYTMGGLTGTRKLRVKTPFGEPSDDLVLGTLEGKRVAFLARHGRGHRILPSEINYRANIYAMKLLGVERIISASAVGSLKEDLRPGEFLVPDQFFDRTKNRASTFFGEGIVAHVAFAHPTCGQLSAVLADACAEEAVKVHRRGTYICIEGPQFSTLAEAEVNRQLRFDVIGMTNLTARSRDLLRDDCHDYGLRLLASRPRIGDGGRDHRDAQPECSERAKSPACGGARAARGAFLPMRCSARTRTGYGLAARVDGHQETAGGHHRKVYFLGEKRVATRGRISCV